MKVTFLHRQYAEANPDLAELYGTDNVAPLRAHFEDYGAAERRGVALDDYIFLEKSLMSEDGHVFLSGWADRRIVDQFAVTVIVGYVMYEFGVLDVSWYDRGDVGEASGDTSRPSGFLLMLKMPDFRIHSDVTLTINGKKFFESDAMRWLSVDKFLFQALADCGPVSSWPIGDTLALAGALLEGFQAVWADYRAGLDFAPFHASPAVTWRREEIAEEVTETEEVEEEIPAEAAEDGPEDAAEDGASQDGAGEDPPPPEPNPEPNPEPEPETEPEPEAPAPATRMVTRTVTRTRMVTRLTRDIDRPIARSIVITLYRSAQMLLPQLELLAPALEGTATEVVVVINELQGEPDLLAERLAAFEQMHDVVISVYVCAGNAGFAAANNFGAAQARGEVLIFMNPDIFPPDGQEAQALAFLDGDPGAGLDGALLYYGDGLLMHSGMYTVADHVANARTGAFGPVLRVEHYGKGLTARVGDDADSLADALRDAPAEGVMVSAALWRIRKSVFQEMGGLNEDYVIAYYEDAEFCLRMLEVGRPVRVDRTTRWLHLEGAGSGASPALRTAMWLNRALYSQRFAGSPLVAPVQTDLTRL